MASNAPVAETKPLSFMETLSPIVSLYRPPARPANPATALSDPATPPKLILICSWTGARDIHIAKYITKYQTLYPTSQILLIKSPRSILLKPSTIPAAVSPAVPVIRSVFPSLDAGSDSSPPELMIHLFSNGGSSSLCALYTAFQPSILPPHITIFDSAPGASRVAGTVNFFTVGYSSLQRAVFTPFIYLFAAVVIAGISVGLVPDSIAFWAASHNDKAKNREVGRAYLYSEEDDLVDWKDVERHAKQAEEKGFVVRREKFRGTPHVAHARLEGDRYWGVVREMWEARI